MGEESLKKAKEIESSLKKTIKIPEILETTSIGFKVHFTTKTIGDIPEEKTIFANSQVALGLSFYGIASAVVVVSATAAEKLAGLGSNFLSEGVSDIIDA